MPDSGDNPRFEILVNGERKCIAGIDDLGVLTAALTWALRVPKCMPKEVLNHPKFTEKSWIGNTIDLTVGGLENKGYVDWLAVQVTAGDEVLIRILQPGAVDEPASRRSEQEVFGDCPDYPKDTA